MSIRRSIILSIVLVSILAAFAQSSKETWEFRKMYATADSVYRLAEYWANKTDGEARADALNRSALRLYQELLSEKSALGKINDSALFVANFHCGIILHSFNVVDSAKNYYQRALSIRLSTNDSMYFKPWIYLGIIYYGEGLTDSAAYCFDKAERIASFYPLPLEEQERLYNNLGILHHETGNFSQAVKYFSRAADILPRSSPDYSSLFVTYKNNLASSLIRLGEYEQAMEVYQGIMPMINSKNELYYNIATIKLNSGKPQEALAFYDKVIYPPGRRTRVMAYKAKAMLNLGETKRAKQLLDSARADYLASGNNRKNVAFGLAWKFTGDLDTSLHDYEGALAAYQRAIIQLEPAFADTNISANPSNFSGVFSYLNLFDALVGKAVAWERLSSEKNDRPALEQSLHSYQSAFLLAAYVEKTYNSDESRLFLNTIKYGYHNRPISVCLRLYALTNQKKYLEEAFRFDQLNKASVLSLNIRENEIRNASGDPSGLYRQEDSLKTSITRLSIREADKPDSLSSSRIRDLEIQLDQLRKKINTAPGYAVHQTNKAFPSVSEVQAMLDRETALISYHLADSLITIFTITPATFGVKTILIDSSFFIQLAALNSSLQNINGDLRYQGNVVSAKLFATLLAPIQEVLQDKKRLVIIPDDELNGIPFESLVDEKGKYLVESFAITYQYSTSVLFAKSEQKKNEALLAFAPYAHADSNALPYSGTEVRSVKGTILMDQSATKAQFLASANQYGILHLATHARVDAKNPELSSISFFPEQNNDAVLRAAEIYNLNLDSVRLVILSACETGGGKLEKGEGLMSLARAFAYAGSPNLVSSAWKAEDQSTAFILQQFHRHLAEGLKMDIALQLAKIDLLQSNEIPARLKSPNYWSHLMLVGQYQKQERRSLAIIISLILIGSLLAFFIARKRFGKNRTSSS